MLVKAQCECGNHFEMDKGIPNYFVEYDGMLGYEAIICRLCGRYGDHESRYEADDWSKQFLMKGMVYNLEDTYTGDNNA